MADVNTRKQKSRSKKAALGIKRIEVQLSEKERERLDELCRVRAGVGEPYTADEFISLLIHRNWEHLQKQLVELGTCKKCGSKLPAGCEGVFKGDSACWHTKNANMLHL